MRVITFVFLVFINFSALAGDCVKAINTAPMGTPLSVGDSSLVRIPVLFMPDYLTPIVSCPLILLSGSEYSNLMTVVNDLPLVASRVTVLESNSGSSASESPFDPLKASAIFAFFFSFIVGVWFVAKNIGVILQAVRNW